MKCLIHNIKMFILTNIIFLDPIAKKQLAAVLPNADVGLMILEDIKWRHREDWYLYHLHSLDKSG